MVELRKRKTPPPAPEPKQKKERKTKAKTNTNGDAAAPAEKATEPEVVAGTSTAAPEVSTADETPAAVETKTGPPKTGDKISFEGFGGEIETNEGKKVTLKSLVDESEAGVVLFTYPKASTPGCRCCFPLLFLFRVMVFVCVDVPMARRRKHVDVRV